MPLRLSCAFATSPESPDHAHAAEALGYQNAYFYDSPPLAELEEAGATEVAYQPAGPDPIRELEAFAAVALG